MSVHLQWYINLFVFFSLSSSYSISPIEGRSTLFRIWEPPESHGRTVLCHRLSWTSQALVGDERWRICEQEEGSLWGAAPVYLSQQQAFLEQSLFGILRWVDQVVSLWLLLPLLDWCDLCCNWWNEKNDIWELRRALAEKWACDALTIDCSVLTNYNLACSCQLTMKQQAFRELISVREGEGRGRRKGIVGKQPT